MWWIPKLLILFLWCFNNNSDKMWPKALEIYWLSHPVSLIWPKLGQTPKKDNGKMWCFRSSLSVLSSIRPLFQDHNVQYTLLSEPPRCFTPGVIYPPHTLSGLINNSRQMTDEIQQPAHKCALQIRDASVQYSTFKEMSNRGYNAAALT